MGYIAQSLKHNLKILCRLNNRNLNTQNNIP
jgi:hypothetical protein